MKSKNEENTECPLPLNLCNLCVDKLHKAFTTLMPNDISNVFEKNLENQNTLELITITSLDLNKE